MSQLKRIWVLALLNRREEAETSLTEIMSDLPTANQPRCSDCLFWAGRINQILGKNDEVTNYFQQAIELSNNGRVAQLAQQALGQQIEV